MTVSFIFLVYHGIIIMLKIYVKNRIGSGTNDSRKLRLKNKLPAIIYGNGQDNIKIELNHDNIFSIHSQSIFYKNNLIIIVNDMEHHVKVQMIHHHVFKPKLLHVDFIRVPVK
ncbi:MAG: 50S ribosomal protein L25 [Buchnera aphidicola (Eriosoma harunire)]